MQKNVVISADVFVEDLGSGFSLVNFERKVVADVGIVAGRQYRVRNPATYSSIVNEVIKQTYPHGADEAALRKGVLNSGHEEFLSFAKFVEDTKQLCRDEGIC